ncbi:MAG: PilW family protein, partial [Deltaproteobacteria bacterium]|nr:PilW family protein [Deltaproteobacteria bacterium]
FSESVGEARLFNSWTLELAEKTDASYLRAGDILGLVNGNQACLLEVREVPASGDITEIKIKPNGRFTGPAGPPSGFPVNGAKIYNLKNASLATYYVDENSNQLMVVYHDQLANPDDPKSSPATPIADNIEDLQLFYFFENELINNDNVTLDPGIGSTKLDTKLIHAVSVGLTAKSSVDRSHQLQTRPALFNRTAGTTADRAQRISILETVQLRNANNAKD